MQKRSHQWSKFFSVIYCKWCKFAKTTERILQRLGKLHWLWGRFYPISQTRNWACKLKVVSSRVWPRHWIKSHQTSCQVNWCTAAPLVDSMCSFLSSIHLSVIGQRVMYSNRRKILWWHNQFIVAQSFTPGCTHLFQVGLLLYTPREQLENIIFPTPKRRFISLSNSSQPLKNFSGALDLVVKPGQVNICFHFSINKLKSHHKKIDLYSEDP